MRLLTFLFMHVCLLTQATTPQGASGLPKTWSRDFQVVFHEGGGMMGGNRDIAVRYDSCVYYEHRQGKITNKKFAMTSQLRAAVLRKLHVLNAALLRSDVRGYIIYDMETTSITIQSDDVYIHAAEGATMEVIPGDVVRFEQLCAYLNNFALKKQ